MLTKGVLGQEEQIVGPTGNSVWPSCLGCLSECTWMRPASSQTDLSARKTLLVLLGRPRFPNPNDPQTHQALSLALLPILHHLLLIPHTLDSGSSSLQGGVWVFLLFFFLPRKNSFAALAVSEKHVGGF